MPRLPGVAVVPPVAHHSGYRQIIEEGTVTEDEKTPDESEVVEEHLDEVAGGIGSWPTPERTLKTTPKAMEPLDKNLMEPLDKDALNR